MAYQNPDDPSDDSATVAAQSPSTPSVVVNVNLANILDGLGLKDIVAEILKYGSKMNESVQSTVSKDALLEAIVLGADVGEVTTLMIELSNRGALV